MSKNYDDTENYCKDCDRSIYGKYPSCDINIENNGKYTKPERRATANAVRG